MERLNKYLIKSDATGVTFCGFPIGDYSAGYYENGDLEFICELYKGVYHGKYRSWHRNRSTSILCTYKNGVLHGLYYEWNDKNKLIHKVKYIDGEILFQF